MKQWCALPAEMKRFCVRLWIQRETSARHIRAICTTPPQDTPRRSLNPSATSFSAISTRTRLTLLITMTAQQRSLFCFPSRFRQYLPMSASELPSVWQAQSARSTSKSFAKQQLSLSKIRITTSVTRSLRRILSAEEQLSMIKRLLRTFITPAAAQ